MSQKIRAKMKVQTVVQNEWSDDVSFAPVMGGSTNAEDNSFAAATPRGKLELGIDNNALRGTIKPGQICYVDLTFIEQA